MLTYFCFNFNLEENQENILPWYALGGKALNERLYFYRSLWIGWRSSTTRCLVQNNTSYSSWVMHQGTSFQAMTMKSWAILTPSTYPTCSSCSCPRTQHRLCSPWIPFFVMKRAIIIIAFK